MNMIRSNLTLYTGIGLLLVLAPLTGRAAAPTKEGVFYVAPKGNDQWSGRVSSLNQTKSDGPVATIQHALELARAWKATAQGPNANGAPTIYLTTGNYFLNQPLILRPDDSGLTIAGLGKAAPVLSGGRRIEGWKESLKDGKKLWTAEIPEARNSRWIFRELWMNGRRATRARYPNTGYLKIEHLLDARPDWSRGQTRFRYAPGDLQSWKTITEAEIMVMNRWADSRLPVFSVDEDQRVINFTKRSVFALEEGDLYYVEGMFEALDEPGEWHLDRHAGIIYYLPRPGETLEKSEAIAPYLVQVLRFEGAPEQHQFVSGVTLSNLVFSHTEWCFPEGFASETNKPTISPEPEPQVGGFAQAAIGVPGAVWGQGVRNAAFDNCWFRKLGNYGLELAGGCQSNHIAQCEFSDLGAGGIKIGETAIRSRESEITRANEITDCEIHDGGKMFPSAIGIWIGQSPDNRLVHNSIHDFYYTGISIGWTWGYGAALASNNLVAFNHVHHIGVKSDGDGPILSDMGGIYTLGKQPGTRVINNLWHDIAGLRYGGWGIYFDEGSSGIIAQSNVVYRTTHGGFHQHYGETNSVWNNVFAFGRDQQLQRTRAEPHQSFSFETNIVFFDSGILLGSNWSGDNYQMDWNLLFDARPGARPEQMRFADTTLEQWRGRGHDLHSIIADPLFVAPGKYDFQLGPNSPALKLDFKPIDVRSVGVRPDKQRGKGSGSY